MVGERTWLGGVFLPIAGIHFDLAVATPNIVFADYHWQISFQKKMQPGESHFEKRVSFTLRWSSVCFIISCSDCANLSLTFVSPPLQ